MASQRPTGNLIEMLEKQAKDIRKLKRRLSGIGSEDWNRPTLQNSWVNYGSPYEEAGYKKLSNGLVLVVGLVRDGTYGDTIFTLPSGYRPNNDLILRQQSDGGGNRVDVKPEGHVIALTNGGDGGIWLSLSGIMFYADGS